MAMNAKTFSLPRNMLMSMPMDMSSRVTAAKGLC
jgi:hypothetical protein